MNNSGDLLKLLERIPATRILVVGDCMLDRYWRGNATRISPEAPVPVVALKSVSNIPGGAANVAANIAALGADVILAGVIGADGAGECLRRSLREHSISDEFLLLSETRPTTAKTRVLVHNQQIARIDEETDIPLTAPEEAGLLAHVKSVIADVDAIVLSDYAKGCLTRSLIASVIAEAKQHGRPLIADPKSRDLTKYSHATILTPNLNEALNAAGIENGGEEMADVAAKKILSYTAIDSLLITLGEHGMKLFRTGEDPVHFPSLARQVFDVTGAGDTVAALLTAAIGAKADMHSAITFANIGAGLAVEKVGTTVIAADELRSAIELNIRHVNTANH
ncbi:MAG: D-glycero-beta-D-manno-heptose-7-phosphate kinase [Acidobacteria bacterium]|nr:D-glycero-beta-D-manno-heptose-7-phosphate kinase [Acidobacteriota bacterium]